jgi:hypothetical protein
MQNTLVDIMKAAKAHFGRLPLLVILDTLSAATEMDENSSKEMSNLTSTIRRMIEAYKLCFLYVHHSTKSGGTVLRGHSSLEGDVDGIMEITLDERNRTSMALVKAHRWYTPGRTFYYKAEQVPTGRMDEDGDIEEAPILVPVSDAVAAKSKHLIWLENELETVFERIGNTTLEGDELRDLIGKFEVESDLSKNGVRRAKREVFAELEQGTSFEIERNLSKQVVGIRKL